MNHLETIKSKIVSGAELSRILAIKKFQGEKIVFTNGCFDIIHRGHVEYLAQAASCGTFLVIGLNSDASVKRLKGPSRPLQDENTRALTLAAMSFVGVVVLFEEETPYNLINQVQPNVLVKGGDYVVENIVGYDIVKANGGEVLTIPFVDGFSTTGIIEKMK